MIVYVDLEHDHLQHDPAAWEKWLARRRKSQQRLEEISGHACLIVRYYDVNPTLLRDLQARAVLVSGCYSEFEHYDEKSLAGLRAVYQAAAWPLLGFCAGHQLLAQAYGAELGPLGPLPPGAPDPYAGHYGHVPGMKQERGFMPVRVCAAHPLFAGLDERPVVFQAHYWEVKAVPAGFHRLAESELCSIQAIGHGERPLFGLQFHPEEYDEAHPAGRQVLENFFKCIASEI
jgi:GMP synthase-like glutamine amidotransferase